MNIIDRTTGAQYYQGGVPDPSQGTNVVYGTGATEQFGAGENPHFFLSAGDNYANQGGVAAAVPGTDLYNNLRDDARTRSLQGVAQVGALVGGAAALGGTQWGQGGAATGGGAAQTFPMTAGGPVTATPLAGAAPGTFGQAAGLAGGGTAAGGAAAAGGNFLDNWLPTITGGVNALLGAHTANSAADAESAAMQAAIDEQRRQYDTTRQDLMPWMQAGQGALNNLQNPATAYQASPGYAWARSEGQRDIGNQFAARGAGQSGNALRALSEFQTGLAQQDYGNWWNQQAGLAGVGQSATTNAAAMGQNTAGNVGNYLAGQGQSRASGIWNRNASLGQGLQDGVSNWLYRRRAA